MAIEAVWPDIIETLHALSQLPLETKNKNQGLRMIADLSMRALRTQACSLALIDSEGRYLALAACRGFDADFERRMVGKRVEPCATGDGKQLDFALFARGEIIEQANLQVAGQSIVNNQIAQRYNLKSVLSYPLKSEGRLIGYFNHFSSNSEGFSEQDKRLLEIFAANAVLFIERFKHYHTFESLKILNALSESLLSVSPRDVLGQVAEKARELLSVPICILWELDGATEKFKIVATSGGVDEAYKKIELDLEQPGVLYFLKHREVASIPDVTRPHPKYSHLEEARARGWKSILSAPMRVSDQLIGLLDVYTLRPRTFKGWERELFGAFANQAALSIQKKELLREGFELREFNSRERSVKTVAEIQHAVSKVASVRQIPLGGQSEDTFNTVVEKCAMAVHAKACFLRLLNSATDELELKAAYLQLNPRPSIPIGHKVKIGEAISGNVAASGKAYLCGDIKRMPEHSELYTNIGLRSVLCVPIKSDDMVIGTISVGHDQLDMFGPEAKHLLEKIVESVSHAIERANLMDGLSRLEEATSHSESFDALLRQLVELTRDFMRESVCVVWLLDKDRNGFVAKAAAVPDGQEGTLEGLCISPTRQDMERFLHLGEPLYVPDASEVQEHPYLDTVKRLGWRSLIAAPLIFKGRLIGFLEVYSHKKKRSFTSWHRWQFRTLAAQACLAVETFNSPKRFERLQEIYHELTESREVNELLELLLDRSLELVGSKRGWISHLNFRTNRMEVVAHRDGPLPPSKLGELENGRGISGLALRKGKPMRADDVHQSPWQRVYDACWPNTQSVLAVPLIVSNATVRVGREVRNVSKPLGVINVESPTLDAFTQADEDVLWSLARHAATVIEKLEFDRKLTELHRSLTKVLSINDWDETIRVVLRAITETLGFEYVSISLVEPELNRIKTEYVIGIPEKDVDEFKKRSVYSLESHEIKAETVRSKAIEVPNMGDERFDEQIFKRFGHGQLIRVFIPMIVPSGERAIGTVEAGYRRGFRTYIYERDVQILKGFVDYAVRALERRKQGLLERINHEFTAPIVGIRNNAIFSQDHFKELSEEQRYQINNEILTDCEALLHQLNVLRYLLGGKYPASKKERTQVYRDIIAKTINQIKPLVIERGFDASRIKCGVADLDWVKIYADKAKLNSVVYNILRNSIKYAEDNPENFRISITADEIDEFIRFSFKDWGIGIQTGLEEAIFDEGYRAPEAIERSVTGSGLGLTIARGVLREIGGDLRLVGHYKPTEFQILLPKSLKEKPKEKPDDLIH